MEVAVKFIFVIFGLLISAPSIASSYPQVPRVTVLGLNGEIYSDPWHFVGKKFVGELPFYNPGSVQWLDKDSLLVTTLSDFRGFVGALYVDLDQDHFHRCQDGQTSRWLGGDPYSYETVGAGQRTVPVFVRGCGSFPRFKEKDVHSNYKNESTQELLRSKWDKLLEYLK